MIEKPTKEELRNHIDDCLPLVHTCSDCHEKTLIESWKDMYHAKHSSYMWFTCAHCGKSNISPLSGFFGHDMWYVDALPKEPSIWQEIKISLGLIPFAKSIYENWERNHFRYNGYLEMLPPKKEIRGVLDGRNDEAYDLPF